MFILRHFSGLIVWGLIASIFALEIALGSMFMDKANNAESDGNYTNMDSKEGNQTIAGIFFAMAILLVLFVLCMWSRIKLAIAITKVIIFLSFFFK
jgi:hypothetical protein